MEEILALVFKTYLATVGLSAMVKVYKDVKTKQIIEEKGYELVKGDKETQEFIADFFKENFYILKPIKNITRTWKLFWGNTKKYASEKINNYQNEGRLKDITPIKEEVKPQKIKEVKEVKKPEIKQEKQQEKNNELIVDEFKNEIENSNDVVFISEIKKTYRQKSKEERNKYAVLSSEFKSTTDKTKKEEIKEEIKRICRRVKAYDELYLCAKVRMVELQNTMNISMKK